MGLFGRRQDADSPRGELARVRALLAAQAFASPRLRAAHEVGAASQAGSAAEIDEALAADGLPKVEELGRVRVSGTWSWWTLHRRKRKIGRALAR